MSHRLQPEHGPTVSGHNEASVSHSKQSKTWQNEHQRQDSNRLSGFWEHICFALYFVRSEATRTQYNTI